LKDKTAGQIADTLEDMLASMGFSATEVLGAMLGSPVPKPYQKIARLGYRAGWKAAFKKNPEPSKAKLAEALAMIRAFKSTPHKMRTLLKQTLKKLPHAPGGPPRKIRPEDEFILCAEIMGLRAECDTREAIRRVAAKRQISERTIYRIWGKHHPKKTKSSSARKVD
jgi:hypothetical protein